MRLFWLPKAVAAVVVASVEFLADLLVRAPVEQIARARRHREQRPNEEYWGLGSYRDVARDLAAAGVEARSGCGCLGCDRLRGQATEVMFRLNDDDIAELARNGIAWGSE